MGPSDDEVLTVSRPVTDHRPRLLRVADVLDGFTSLIGKVMAPLIFVMIAVIMIEVFGRYFFNRPTPWAHDVSSWLQVAYIFLGGAFALQRGYLVRVDLLFAVLPRRAQAVIDLSLSSTLFAVFAIVVVSRGLDFAMLSWNMGETSATGVWQGPVWPAKFLVPIGMILMTLAWLAHCSRQIVHLVDPERQLDRPRPKVVG